MTVSKNDKVTLTDGVRTKEFVVLGFTKSHANLARADYFADSMEKYGEYRKSFYGYTAWNLKSSGVQLGFWKLLSSVNGVSVA
jgi:hypothetical protein